MRVWLVDDRRGEDPASLEALLRRLAERPGSGVVLLGARPFGPDLANELHVRQPDLLVVHEAAWPDAPWPQDLLGLGVVVAASPERVRRFQSLADNCNCPLTFVPPSPCADGLALARQTALCARRRHAHWVAQVERLQKRLDDRIIIERAKGILVQRLNITEEEAYKRLRVLSRRQRRQIRDIAQSLLDTQSLLLPEANGFLGDHDGPENGRDDEKLLPPL